LSGCRSTRCYSECLKALQLRPIQVRGPLNEQGAYWAVVLEVLNATLHKEALGDSCNAYVCREDRVGPLTVPSLGLEALF